MMKLTFYWASWRHRLDGQRPRTTLDAPGSMDTTAEKMRVGVLKLFVYGTLKRGCRNHDHYCRGALNIRDAEVRGRLYDGPGFPVLEVPGEDVLARGTADPVADAATQARLSRRTGRYPRPVPERAAADDWGVVCGELLTFDDPEARLPAIDRLDGTSLPKLV